MTFKTKLKGCVIRMGGQMNKKANQLKKDRKAIAQLLADKKDESARISVENVFAQRKLIRSMEILKLQCELLAARGRIIETSDVCPDDLEQACASIIYCTKRIDIPELMDISKQLAAKFSEDWARNHTNNQSGKVHPQIVANTEIRAPTFQSVIKELQKIADQYSVPWVPDFEDPTNTDPNALGSIAPIEREEKEYAVANSASTPAPAFRPSNFQYQAGTLNITVYKARKLYSTSFFGKQDPFIQLKIKGRNNPVYKTKVHRNAGQVAEFVQEHHPFHIPQSGLLLSVEVYNKGKLTNDFIGRAELDVDRLIQTPEPTWYRLGRNVQQSRDAGEVLLSTQFMMLNSNGGEMKQPVQGMNAVSNMIAGLPQTPGMAQPTPMQAPQPIQPPQPIPPPASFQQQPPQYQPSANMNAAPAQPNNDMNQMPGNMNYMPPQPNMGMGMQQPPPQQQPQPTPGCDDANQEPSLDDLEARFRALQD